MGVSIGDQLGFHEITALLGKGGMGEVYRARDLKLKREVAIKILPDEFSRDADRVSRFQREAEILASLNHPNIATIHSFEEGNGTRYLVLELVVGETIADRLRRGPIPVAEALAIAKNICEALEAAHDKSVVHRDLKPANIKVTPDGKVKVLDFGLAKALDPSAGQAAGEGFSNSPTLVNSFAATNAGVIIGTAAYMSPEQARGFVADQRSDIFSFGCVLYEMLSGQRAFDGETVSDILASVLAREPDFTILPKDLSPRLLEFLRRCVSKNRKRRWHCVADLHAELEAIAASPQATPAVVPPVVQTRPFWKRALPLAATALLFTAITGVAVWKVKPVTQLPVTRFSILLPAGQQLPVSTNGLAVSPDGSQIVYATDRQFYLRSLSEMEAKPLAGTERHGLAIYNPAFSPDGRELAYVDAASVNDVTLKKIAVTGGAPVTLYKGPALIGLQWDATGIVFAQFAPRSHKILRILPTGGSPEVLATLKDDEFVAGAQLLPGGKAVLFSTSNDANNWEKARVVVQDLKSGQRKTVVEGGMAARYLPTGHIVYVLGGTMFGVRFDPQKLELLSGGPIPVVEGVRQSGAGIVLYSFSSSGSLVYIPGPIGSSLSTQTPLVRVERSGEIKPLNLPIGNYVSPRVSPDGKRIAFGTEKDNEAIIWIYDLSGVSSMRRLTFGGANRYPVWSPDGRRVAFQSDRDGNSGIYWQLADGTGSVERLTKAEKGISHSPDSWSPDGQWLSFTVTKADSMALWIFSQQTKKATPFDEAPDKFIGRSNFSPDGKWIAYQSSETGRNEIFVKPFPATGERSRFQITRETDSHHPLWSPDGKELFYIPGPLRFLKVAISTQPNFSYGNPVPALNGPVLIEMGPFAVRAYDMTPDGKEFLGAVPGGFAIAGSQAPEIQVVLNWFEELKQRVPVR